MKYSNFITVFAFFSYLLLNAQQQDICFGDVKTYSVDLPSGTPGSTYDWTIQEAAFAGTITGNGNYTIDIDWGATPIGTYTLQVIETNNSCPGEPQLLSIVIHPLPEEPVVTNNSAICSGETGIFTFSGGSGDTVNYTINGIGASVTLDNTGQGVVEVVNANENQILVINSVTNSFGCSISGTISSEIVVNPLPAEPSVTNNGPICFDENAEFIINAAPLDEITYTLNGIAGTITMDNTGTASIMITNAGENQNLQLNTITNTYGCSISLSQASEIQVNSLPFEPTITNNSPICSGEDAVFNIQGASGDMVSYILNGISGEITLDASGNGEIVTFGATEDQNLQLIKVMNTSGCMININLVSNIVVNPLPAEPILSSNNPICFGETAEFYLEGAPGETINYLLNNISGMIVLDDSGRATISLPNTQTDQILELQEIINEYGCSIALNISETITVNPLPTTSAINFN